MSTSHWFDSLWMRRPYRGFWMVFLLGLGLIAVIGCLCTTSATAPTPIAVEQLSPTPTETATATPTRPTLAPTFTWTPGRLTRIAMTQAAFLTPPTPAEEPDVTEAPAGQRTNTPGGRPSQTPTAARLRTNTPTFQSVFPTRTPTTRYVFPTVTPRPTWTLAPTPNRTATATVMTATAAARQTATRAVINTLTATARTQQAFFTEVAQTATALPGTQTAIAWTATAQALRPNLIAYSADINGDGLLDLLNTINSPSGGTLEILRASSENLLLCDWSPEGAWLVYERYPDGGTHRLFRVRSDGSGEQALANQPSGGNTLASWSPDGQWIAFRNEDGGNVRLYALRPADGTLVQLWSGWDVLQPDWSSDGRLLIFVRADSGATEFYTLDVAVLPRPNPALNPTPTPQPFPVTMPGGATGTKSWPRYAPGGDRLAFIFEGDLWLLTLGQPQNDSNPSNLTSGFDEQVTEPSWSRDGSKIVFRSQGELFVIDLSANPIAIAQIPNVSGGNKQRPNWLP